MKVEYPVLPSDAEKADEFTKEALIARYYGHRNRFGFFPIGRLNAWHGGIHIENFGTKVRAIADGRIIAYRIPEKYLVEKDTQRNYSNGFILIQHQYEKEGKNSKGEDASVKFRFYSLYMHLQPKDELENGNGENVPDLYAKYTAKVTGNEIARGLNARSGSETTGSGEYRKGKKVVLIPVGATVTLDPLPEEQPVSAPADVSPMGFSFFSSPFSTQPTVATQPPVAKPAHWTDLSKRTEAAYKRVKYKNYIDIYIATANGRIKDLGNGKCQITTTEDSLAEYPAAKKIVGVNVYDTPNSKQGKYLRTIKKGEELGEVVKKSDNWYQLKDKEEYLAAGAITIIKHIKDDVKFDSIENVDVPIKAGDVLGVPSKYAFEKQDSYSTLHLEVFTDDNGVNDFIENTQDFNDRTSYEVIKDTTLQIAKPCNFLKKNTKVKIYKIKDDYIQIGFENLSCITQRSNLNYHNKKKPYYYTIKEDFFDEINGLLENILPNKNAKVYYKNTIGTDREIIYKVKNAGKKYWVKSTEVKGNKNEWVSLANDVSVIYEKEPNKNTKDSTVIETAKVRKVTTAQDNQGNEWWYIKTKKEEGWVEKSKLTAKNPYNWKNYGWDVYEDSDNNYLYHFGESVNDEAPKDFVNKVWDTLKEYDENPNKVLTVHELQKAMRNEKAIHLVSKLVCKHTSEWNTLNNLAGFANEVDAIYAKGIEQASSEEQTTLTEARDAKKVLLEEKIKELCFWSEIENGEIPNAYTPKEQQTFKRQFPSNSNVYHLHPIAFVEQMKMLVTLDDIDLRSSITWQTQFSEIFGSKKQQKKSCYKASKVVLKNGGIEQGGNLGTYSKVKNKYNFFDNTNVIQTAVEFNKEIVILEDGAKKAIKYLDQELEKGNPILVGVRHSYFEYIESKKHEYIHSHDEWNYDKSTDHFIVIIGRGYDEGKRFFRFYEVGTGNKANGTHNDNKLFINEDFSLTGNPQHKKSRTYTLTHVRGNKTNGNFN